MVIKACLIVIAFCALFLTAFISLTIYAVIRKQKRQISKNYCSNLNNRLKK